MNKIFEVPLYPYERSPDQDALNAVRHPVVVVGAGPIGLALAIDLAQQDLPVVVLDDNDKVSIGSRAICFAKRPLEILDRLGCGERDGRQGRRVERRQGLLPRAAGLRLRPAAREGPPAPGLHQSAAVLPRGIPGRAGPRAGSRGQADPASGRNKVAAVGTHADPCPARDRDARTAPTRSRPTG